jgi:hypothetical protein
MAAFEELQVRRQRGTSITHDFDFAPRLQTGVIIQNTSDRLSIVLVPESTGF